jgi:hypothetical protein
MLLLDGILIGLAASLLTGGRFRCASQNPLRMEAWLVGGLLVQLLWPWVAPRLGVGVREFLVVWLLVAALVLGVSIVNARVPGMLLVTAGMLLNIVVIVLNGGMPVDAAQAATSAEAATNALAVSLLHTPLTDTTTLAPLGDIIYVPGPSWHRGLVSVGDVLMAVGAGIVAFWALRCHSPHGEDGDAQ